MTRRQMTLNTGSNLGKSARPLFASPPEPTSDQVDQAILKLTPRQQSALLTFLPGIRNKAFDEEAHQLCMAGLLTHPFLPGAGSYAISPFVYAYTPLGRAAQKRLRENET